MKRVKSYISLFVIFDKRLRRNFSFIFLSYLEGKKFLHNNSSFPCICQTMERKLLFNFFSFFSIFLGPNPLLGLIDLPTKISGSIYYGLAFNLRFSIFPFGRPCYNIVSVFLLFGVGWKTPLFFNHGAKIAQDQLESHLISTRPVGMLRVITSITIWSVLWYFLKI